MLTESTEVTDAELAQVLSGADSDAPFGRFKNGKPRKRPATRDAIPSVPGPRKVNRSSSSSSAKKGQPDYEQLSRNVLQFPIMLLSMGGQTLQQIGRPELGTSVALDGMTLALYTEQLAEVGREMAEADGKVARWLEKFGRGGAIGKGVSLGVMIGCQMLVNHGRMAPIPAAGLLEPAEVYRRAQEMVGAPAAPEGGTSDGVSGS